MSFLGYGNLTPGANINGDFVNKDSSNYAGNFGSNQIPNSCMRGGKKIKRKIKNITKQYKMKGGKGASKKLITRLKNKMMAKSMALAKTITGGKTLSGGKKGRKTRGRKSIRNTRKSRARKQRGGNYTQYQNNMPNTPSYSTGGVLIAADSALANPTPYKLLGGTANCVDNYNHFTGQGFSSIGH